jgi:hypothetical protein
MRSGFVKRRDINLGFRFPPSAPVYAPPNIRETSGIAASEPMSAR